MKVKIESTRVIKPIYEGISPPTSDYMPLSVFDKVTYDTHIAVIYAFRPPMPPNETIEHGLQRALSEYRECAGRLGGTESAPVIFLNDNGVKFVEASVDSKLGQLTPLKPSPMLLSFHPSLEDVEELVQVQLTRFTCGSLVVGFTAHHLVADGHSISNFLVAWGKACRGLDMNPLPFHDRTIFHPRKPPCFDFEHSGLEFKSDEPMRNTPYHDHKSINEIVVHKVHFTVEFLRKLKARASKPLMISGDNNNNNPYYSTFESLVAHLWRAITKARGLAGDETTQVRISVNGRMRMTNPQVPNEYFGNLVLRAFPTARVKDLLREPLPYAAKIIHDAIVNVNNDYYKSFIDFATHKAKEDCLVPTADMNKSALSPNLEVDSWLRFPFYDLDFGGGSPHIFMPSYFPTEGMLFLLPSYIGDGSIDAYVPLSCDNVATFEEVCYSLDSVTDLHRHWWRPLPSLEPSIIGGSVTEFIGGASGVVIGAPPRCELNNERMNLRKIRSAL